MKAFYATVEKVMRVLAPYKLTSRESQVVSSTVKVGDVEIGGRAVVRAGVPTELLGVTRTGSFLRTGQRTSVPVSTNPDTTKEVLAHVG
jgi:hypothetical protein